MRPPLRLWRAHCGWRPRPLRPLPLSVCVSSPWGWVLATRKKGTNQQQPKANEWRRVIKSRGRRGGRRRERGGAGRWRMGDDGGSGMDGGGPRTLGSVGGRRIWRLAREGQEGEGKAATRAEEDDWNCSPPSTDLVLTCSTAQRLVGYTLHFPLLATLLLTNSPDPLYGCPDWEQLLP